MNASGETPLLARRYRLLRRLGRGGMAEVYLARDTLLERDVAVKVLRPRYARSPAFRARFHQEAKAAANLSHPNIVTVYDFGEDAGQLFIVMEYVPGQTLYAYLKARGRLPVEEALRLMVQACAGVGYAHRARLVHCDLKPQNLLLAPGKRLKVADFGIARALAALPAAEESPVVWGSPLYFSPEQAAGLTPVPASDVYSLGVILYQMLTGRLPFVADNPIELARMHREVTPIPPRAFNPRIPPDLEKVILKTLAKEPSARYRTADQLGRILLNFLPGEARPAGERALRPAAPSRAPSPPQSPPPAAVEADAEPNPLAVDWISVGLGLLAVLAWGGLCPLWLYVYLLYTR